MYLVSRREAMQFTKSILVSILISTSFPTMAISFFDSLDMGEYLAENAYGFLPVPILITEPALGYGGGVMGVFLHESEEQKLARKNMAEQSIDGGAKLLTPAITVAGGFATENGTKAMFIGHRRLWNDDTIRYMGGAFYGDMFMNFYGTYAVSSKGFEMNMKGGGVMQKLQFRINDTPLFLGMTQTFIRPELSVTNRDRLNEVAAKWLNLTPNVSGLGLIAEYDTQNSFLYPTDGGNYVAEYNVFNGAIGSDYDFELLTLNGKQYFPITKEWNLGLKGSFKGISTAERALPPPAYPDIDIRGIARNRYQGETTAAVESQLTWQFSTRWSTSVFGGVGSATDSVGDLFSLENHYAYGVGFRYLIARRYGMHTGIDIAKSEEDDALYFQVGTGF